MSFSLSNLGPWAAALVPASWRGIPFHVEESEFGHGRRTATHAYPFRDSIWIEDLGLGERRLGFRAFLLGDDVYAQAAALDAAVDTPGAGTLVHPALGPITCSLISFTRRERAESGRKIECDLTFLRQGQQLFPSSQDNTDDLVSDGADDLDSDSASDFSVDVAGPIGQASQQTTGVPLANSTPVSGAEDAISDTVEDFGDQATPFISDPGLIAGAVAGLVPPPSVYYGRYGMGALAVALPPTATVASVMAAQITAATAVTTAALAASASAAAL